MDRNNNMQRPTLHSRHTSQLPLLMNILFESYTFPENNITIPDSNIASPDAPITPSTDTSTPTHENSHPTDPIPKEDTQASNKSSNMSTSPEKQILTDIRVSCVFIQGNELAEKVRAVIDEAHHRRFQAEYYVKFRDPSLTRMGKSSELVQLLPLANEFFAKNMDLRRLRTETNTTTRKHAKPGFEHPGNDKTHYTPVPAVGDGCDANFRRVENSFLPIYTRSPFTHVNTKGVQMSWHGEKRVHFGPIDDIPYFNPQSHEPCVEQATRHTFRDLSADISGTEYSSSCSSAGDSQGSDDTTLTSPDDEWSPLGSAGVMETPQPGDSTAPAEPADSIETLLASLGVTGSPKPVDDRPLPPYQPLPKYSSLPDRQRTPRSFADYSPTLSESSEEEVRGRTISWSSSSTIRANSRDKHRNYTYRHRSPNRIHSPINKRASSPDWTELERQKTRALNIRLNGSRSFHKLKGKQSRSISHAHNPATPRKVPDIRSFAILDTPAASGFTANGMRHDLEDIAEEVLAEENAQANSPFDTNKESVSEIYSQETDSDESGVLFMKGSTKRWNLKARSRANDPEQELEYHPIPDGKIGLTSNHWGSEESLATTIADTEETNLLLTKVPFLVKGKQRAEEYSSGYEYHLLRHTNTASIRESWSSNGVFVIGTDEENQTLLTQNYSPASPRINPIDYKSFYSDQNTVAGSSQDIGAPEYKRIKLCRTNSIPELDLDSVPSQHSVPRTLPSSPRSFEEHQEIKHGLLFNSYPKISAQIPTGPFYHHHISNSGSGSMRGFTKTSSIRNGYYQPIHYGLRVNIVRIDTNGSEASNPQPEASNQRRGHDSGYSSATPEQTGPIVPMTGPVTANTSDDSTDVTRGRTATRSRTHPVSLNTRPTRSQPRRGTGRVSFAPLPDTRRERATSEGHIYHTEFSRRQAQLSRSQERSLSPSHRFKHEDHVYDEDEKPKIELPPVRKEPLKADSPPPEDLNAPARAISEQPHPYVHQRLEQEQRTSDPMDLSNFMPGLQMGQGSGSGSGKGKNGKKGKKGGKGKYISMRAMVPSFSDIGRLFKRSQGSKDSNGSKGSGVFSAEEESGNNEKGYPVMTENSMRDWHRPLVIRTKASFVRENKLPEFGHPISRMEEDSVNDSPPLSPSSTLYGHFEEELVPARAAREEGKQKTGEKIFGHKPIFVFKNVEVPLSPPASSVNLETEDVFEWQEKTEHQRLRIGSKTYVFDECLEVVDIHSPRKDKSHRNEKYVCGEVVNFSHLTSSPKEAVQLTPAKRLKAHLDCTRDSRLRRGTGSTCSTEDPNRHCSRCGKASCVCGRGDLDRDGPEQDDYENSDQRRCESYRTRFTERNAGFHSLIPLADTHGSDDQNDAFDEYDEAEEWDVDDSSEKDLVTFSAFTGPSKISENNRERLDLLPRIGSFNSDEYERQDKGDPGFSEESEDWDVKVADLYSNACAQNNARLPTLQDIAKENEIAIASWLAELATLEEGLSTYFSSTPQIDQTQKYDALKEAMAQTIQHINHLVHIRKSAPVNDDDEPPVGQRWQDRWREAFMGSLVHLHRLIEQDDDRQVNELMDRQLREQELEMAEVDRKMAEQKREIWKQERCDAFDKEARECRWYEWFDVDLNGIGDLERVQFMVGHMVAARISWGMLSEREMSGC